MPLMRPMPLPCCPARMARCLPFRRPFRRADFRRLPAPIHAGCGECAAPAGRKWCICAAAPARRERANRRAVPDRGDVRADAGVRGFPADGQRNDRAVGAPFRRARRKHAVRCLFKQFRDIQHLCAFAGGRLILSAFGCADALLDSLGGRAAAGVCQSAHKQHRRKLLRPAGCGFRRIQPPLRSARPQGICGLRAGRRFPLFHRRRDDLLRCAAL